MRSVLCVAALAGSLVLGGCREPAKGVGDPGSIFPGAISVIPAVLPDANRVGDQLVVQYQLIIRNEGTTDVEIRNVVAVNQNGKTLEQLDKKEFARRTGLEGAVLSAGEQTVLGLVVVSKDMKNLETISHRFQLAPASGTKNKQAKAYTVAGGVLKVERHAPAFFSAPVASGRWLVQGPFDPSPGVQQLVEDVDGTNVLPRRFQVSLTRITGTGSTSLGTGASNEDYPSFGADVLSMTEGTVVQVQNGIDDHAPGRADSEEPTGNFVLIQAPRDLYVVYEGLRKGSIGLRPGDAVKAGARLGSIGNTGMSVEPELRIRVLSAPDVSKSTSLEFGFRSFRWLGWMKGVRHIDRLEKAMSLGIRRGETPPSGSIVEF